jgi:hypothetical protein
MTSIFRKRDRERTPRKFLWVLWTKTGRQNKMSNTTKWKNLGVIIETWLL